MSKIYCFEGLLTDAGWLSPAWVEVSDDGLLVQMQDVPFAHNEGHKEPKPEKTEVVRGYGIPAFQNAHSHAFQYAMAGLAEHLPVGAGSDDFWSWREAMYRLALTVTPERLEEIAFVLYSEMLRFGYSSVAEFHYLHHDCNGEPFDDLALMGKHLVRAAERAGIRLTLIPIFYQMGGFGQPAEEHQRRFLSQNVESYFRLLEATQKAVEASSHATFGFGVHSLRAVGADDLIEAYQTVQPELPRHIHISEQQKEVDACLSHTGFRPVAWLSEHVELGKNDHLVHATHIDATEIDSIASAQAKVVLCPSTEGNLGDGFFPLVPYMQAGGHWSIGTDSHIGLHPLEELRLLDYGQRLRHQKRNILCSQEGENSGQIVFREALFSGRSAMGLSGTVLSSFFAIGEPFDALVFDADTPLFSMRPKEQRFSQMLSTMVYALGSHAFLGTIVGGDWVVCDKKMGREKAVCLL